MANETTHILIAAPLYPPEIGGPATYVKMLETELAGSAITLTIVPFSSVRGWPKGIRHLIYTWKLWRRAWGADFVYALDPVSVGVPAFVASVLSRRALWVRLGGDYAWEQGVQRFGLTATLDEYTSAPKQAARAVRFLAAVERHIVKRAKRVIVPSHYLATVVRTWGVDPKRLTVIYSALNPLPKTLNRIEARAKLGAAGPVLLSAGRLVPWKGFPALVQVIARLRDMYPEIRLYIAGSGPDEAELRKEIDTMNLSEQIILLGRVSKDMLSEYVNAADVFVLNTAYEGLSHVLLEVIDSGIPVVTTTVGGNPELVKDGESGALVAYNDIDALTDRINELLADTTLATRLSSNAKQQLEQFTTATVVKQFMELTAKENTEKL